MKFDYHFLTFALMQFTYMHVININSMTIFLKMPHLSHFTSIGLHPEGFAETAGGKLVWII